MSSTLPVYTTEGGEICDAGRLSLKGAMRQFIENYERTLSRTTLDTAFGEFKPDVVDGTVTGRTLCEAHRVYPSVGGIDYIDFMRGQYRALAEIVPGFISLLGQYHKEGSKSLKLELLDSIQALFSMRHDFRGLFRYIVQKNTRTKDGIKTYEGIDNLINETALLHLVELGLQEILMQTTAQYDSSDSSAESSPTVSPDSSPMARPMSPVTPTKRGHLSRCKKALKIMRLLNLLRYSHNFKAISDISSEHSLVYKALDDFLAKPKLGYLNHLTSRYNRDVHKLVQDIKDKEEVVLAGKELVQHQKTTYEEKEKELTAEIRRVSKDKSCRSAGVSAGLIQEDMAALNSEIEKSQQYVAEQEGEINAIKSNIQQLSTDLFDKLIFSGIIFEILKKGEGFEREEVWVDGLFGFIERLILKPSQLSDTKEKFFASIYTVMINGNHYLLEKRLSCREQQEKNYHNSICYLTKIVMEKPNSEDAPLDLYVEPSHRTRGCQLSAAAALLRHYIDLAGMIEFDSKLLTACVQLLSEKASIKFSSIAASTLKELEAVMEPEKFSELWRSSMGIKPGELLSTSPDSLAGFLERTLTHAAEVKVTGLQDPFAFNVLRCVTRHVPTSSPKMSPSFNELVLSVEDMPSCGPVEDRNALMHMKCATEGFSGMRRDRSRELLAVLVMQQSCQLCTEELFNFLTGSGARPYSPPRPTLVLVHRTSPSGDSGSHAGAGVGAEGDLSFARKDSHFTLGKPALPPSSGGYGTELSSFKRRQQIPPAVVSPRGSSPFGFTHD